MTVKFVAVRKNTAGEITHIKTDDGRSLSFAEARELVHRNEVDSLTEIYPDGRWEISLPTNTEMGSNLDNLPPF